MSYNSQTQARIVTPKEYFQIAIGRLHGHRQPLLSWSSKTKKWYLGGREFDEDDENLYKYYVYILRYEIGIPTFETEMNLLLTDDGRNYYYSTMNVDLSQSPS